MSTLESKISEYAKAYYEGDPIISDEEFDNLIDQLKKENPNSRILKTPGWGYFPASQHLKKHKHIGEIGSLEKIKINNFGKVQKWSEFAASPKLDGASAVAYYKNGKLQYVLSRGNGKIGLDITSNLLPGKTIPTKVSPDITAVRGEIIITDEDFEKLNEGAHPRNLASGFSQSKNIDKEKLKNLKFITHSIVSTKKEVKTYGQMIRLLQKENFITVPYQTFSKSTFLKSVEKEEISLKNPNFRHIIGVGHVQIDGIVICKNVIQKNDVITLDAKAIKFESESDITVVKTINWNISRTGRLVPLIEIEPVFLSGAKITYVTGNNYKWLTERKIGPGSKVEVCRSNEVIPTIVKVIEDSIVDKPTTCPLCQSKLHQVGVDLICPNQLCEAKQNFPVETILSIVKPDGIGTKIINELIDKFNLNIDNITTEKTFQLINSNDPDYLETFGIETRKKIRKLFQNLRQHQFTLSELLLICNIPQVGTVVGEQFDKNVSWKEWLSKSNNSAPPVEWRKYFKMTPSWDNFNKFWERVQHITKILQKNCQLQKEKQNKSIDLQIAITGPLSISRNKFITIVSSYGIRVSGISKNTNYLVTNKQDSNTSKIKKAKQFNIPIVSEDKFLQICGIKNSK